MVHIAKRMRAFQPLLNLRQGEGASTLPPPPAPQLTHVRLALPQGLFNTQIHGARRFWREHLRRLKYHNPALPITVNRGPGNVKSPVSLTLHFEGNDPDALWAITKIPWNETPRQQQKKQQQPQEQLSEAELYELARQQSPNWRYNQTPAGDTGGAAAVEEEETPSSSSTNDEDEGVLLKHAPGQSQGTDSTTSEQSPVYTRAVSLALQGREKADIWRWFEHQTKCMPVPLDPEDAELRARLDRVFEQSEVDRRRVKAGVDAMKKEQADLKSAREAAERMTADA